MIISAQGNIFDMPRGTTIVVPVNCQGVMGAGIAKQWMGRTHPVTEQELYRRYRTECRMNHFRPGDILIGHFDPTVDKHRSVFLATKDHWKYESRIEWVVDGLKRLRAHTGEWSQDGALAIPMIGAGHGKLSRADVYREVLDAFRDYPWLVVFFTGTVPALAPA